VDSRSATWASARSIRSGRAPQPANRSRWRIGASRRPSKARGLSEARLAVSRTPVRAAAQRITTSIGSWRRMASTAPAATTSPAASASKAKAAGAARWNSSGGTLCSVSPIGHRLVVGGEATPRSRDDDQIELAVAHHAGTGRDELADDDVLLEAEQAVAPSLPSMAASVSTRVVSWKEAADSHESVASDALVMPMSSGGPRRALPSSTRRLLVSRTPSGRHARRAGSRCRRAPARRPGGSSGAR
jgi:hypothetical protein